MDKKISRHRRAAKTRVRIGRQNAVRLTVHRTNLHIYAQLTSPTGDKVIAAASTTQKSVREGLTGTKNKSAAAAVGKAIAAKAIAAGVEKVAFDRSGFRYHGKIAALADAAREAGLKF